MTISANTVFEARQAGSDTNGGGFVTGSSGTDYSVQNAKNTSGSNISTTDAVGAGTTTITSVTAAFTSAITGNIIYLAGGTGSLAAGWYQATYVSSTSITVDRTVAVGTGITMNIGGALASIGGAAVAGFTTGHILYMLQTATPFSITSATANVAGGGLNTTATVTIAGYTTNRTLTNTDTPPTINFGVSGVSLFVTRALIYNLIINGNGQTSATLQGANDSSCYMNCQIKNMNVAGQSTGVFIGCSATTCSASVFNCVAINCEAYANTATPFRPLVASNCISYNNTGASTRGFDLSYQSNATVKNCTAYGNGSDGFYVITGSRSIGCINCYAEGNAGYGFNDTGTVACYLINCADYNNTSGQYPATTKNIITGFIHLTAGSALVAAGSNNFALNNTTNQGALVRGVGAPALFPSGTTASYIDIGAAQHQDSGGAATYGGMFIQ